MQTLSPIFETTRCLCLAARRAARTITREFDQALRPHGLRATQFTLLAALQLAGPQAIGELAELLSTERTTLTRNLGVAERHGWATMRTSHADARSRVASITPKGLRVLTAALPAWRAAQQRLTESMGAHTADCLRRLAGSPCVMPLSGTPPPARRKNGR